MSCVFRSESWRVGSDPERDGFPWPGSRALVCFCVAVPPRFLVVREQNRPIPRPRPLAKKLLWVEPTRAPLSWPRQSLPFVVPTRSLGRDLFRFSKICAGGSWTALETWIGSALETWIGSASESRIVPAFDLARKSRNGSLGTPFFGLGICLAAPAEGIWPSSKWKKIPWSEEGYRAWRRGRDCVSRLPERCDTWPFSRLWIGSKSDDPTWGSRLWKRCAERRGRASEDPVGPLWRRV